MCQNIATFQIGKYMYIPKSKTRTAQGEMLNK